MTDDCGDGFEGNEGSGQDTGRAHRMTCQGLRSVLMLKGWSQTVSARSKDGHRGNNSEDI